MAHEAPCGCMKKKAFYCATRRNSSLSSVQIPHYCAINSVELKIVQTADDKIVCQWRLVTNKRRGGIFKSRVVTGSSVQNVNPRLQCTTCPLMCGGGSKEGENTSTIWERRISLMQMIKGKWSIGEFLLASLYDWSSSIHWSRGVSAMPKYLPFDNDFAHLTSASFPTIIINKGAYCLLPTIYLLNLLPIGT